MFSKVAVVGPQDLVNEMIRVGSDLPDLELIPLSYSKETEAIDLVKNSMHKVDVVSFTGPVPYLLTKGKVPDYLPLVYVRYSGAALYRTLFEIIRESRGDIDGVKRLSFDTLTVEAVRETYDELGLNSSEIYVLSKETFLDAQAQIEQHRRYYVSGQTSAAVCCLTSTYKELLASGIMAYRIRPTRFDMRETLRLAKIEGLALYHRQAQVAVAIVKMGQTSHNPMNSPQRLTLELHQLLLEYSERTGATVSFVGGDEFILFSTRGALQIATQNFREAPLLNDIREKMGVTASLGLGVGHSAAEAENNARIALKRSRDEGWNTCCILLENGVMVGPLKAESTLEYEIRSIDPRLNAFATQSGLSVTTVSRLQSIVENYGRTTLTANEAARGLNITPRSARRILGALERAKLATVVGMEQPVGKGRPRQVYALQIAREGGLKVCPYPN